MSSNQRIPAAVTCQALCCLVSPRNKRCEQRGKEYADGKLGTVFLCWVHREAMRIRTVTIVAQGKKQLARMTPVEATT